MFAEVLPVRARHLHAELGWLAALLGEVRDLDIQIGRFDDWTEEMPGEHREALDELADLLDSPTVQARRPCSRLSTRSAMTGSCLVSW